MASERDYKCWSPDNFISEEEGEIIASSIDVEDAVETYVRKNFSKNWESPSGTFNVLTYECDANGKALESAETFSIEVDWKPVFYICKSKL
jgi:hypothetical protein